MPFSRLRAPFVSHSLLARQLTHTPPSSHSSLLLCSQSQTRPPAPFCSRTIAPFRSFLFCFSPASDITSNFHRLPVRHAPFSSTYNDTRPRYRLFRHTVLLQQPRKTFLNSNRVRLSQETRTLIQNPPLCTGALTFRPASCPPLPLPTPALISSTRAKGA